MFYLKKSKKNNQRGSIKTQLLTFSAIGFAIVVFGIGFISYQYAKKSYFLKEITNEVIDNDSQKITDLEQKINTVESKIYNQVAPQPKESPEIKIEKCKTLAQNYAQLISKSVYTETYNNSFNLYFQQCKSDPGALSNQTFNEQLQGFGSCLQMAGDLAKNDANNKADSIYQSSYSSSYLDCLNK